MISAERFVLTALVALTGLAGAACSSGRGNEVASAGPQSDNPIAEALTLAVDSTPPASTPLATSIASMPAATYTPWPTPINTTTTAATSQTAEGVTVTTIANTTRYQLTGNTAGQLDFQMRNFGPLDSVGNRWLALTVPLFDWDYTCSCSDSGCTTGPATIYVTLDYSLPVWEPPANTDTLLVERWNLFQRAAVTHERGHGDLAVDCGWQLGQAFVTQPPQASCSAVDSAVSAVSQPVFAACRAAQNEYESTTNHGQTDGVVWPP